MNEHKYTHAWMNTNIHTHEQTHIYTFTLPPPYIYYKHTYTTLHSHLLISTIGRFLDDLHKSTLTAQCTATLDRATFKTHSDLRQRSTTTLPPSIPLHTHSRRHRGTNCATSKLWMPDISKDLSLTRLLFSPHPSHSNLYNRQEYSYILYFNYVIML